MKLVSRTVKVTTTLLFLLIFSNINAQEMLGVTLGNYSGTAGLLINPAGMTTNKVYLDINLATADAFFRNNYVYLPKEDFVIWDAFNKDYEYPTYGDDNRNVTRYENTDLKNGTVSIRGLGPSLCSAIALSTSVFQW